MVVTRWSLLIHSRNMAKSAFPQIIDRNPLRHQESNFHPIYRQTLNKEHFAQYPPVSNEFYAKLWGSWRRIKTRVERQTTTSSHVRDRHPWEFCSFNSFSASVSTLNYQIFTYFVQRRSFLSSCHHLNLKQAFKVKNLVPMTMHHVAAVTGGVLFIKS